MGPQFPIRIIFDDGGYEIIETPEELLEKIDSIDTTDPSSRVIVRDASDRNVRFKMYNGEIVAFDLERGT